MNKVMKLAAIAMVGGLSLGGCASQRESMEASKTAAEQAASEAKQAAAEAKAAAQEAKDAADKANRSYSRGLRK